MKTVTTDNENRKQFNPTLAMIYYWRAYADPFTSAKRSKIAERAVELMKEDGVTPEEIPEAESIRQMTYRWENPEKYPGYQEWVDEIWKSSMRNTKPWLDKVGLRRGVRDFRYWEAMQMKYANYKRKSDVTTDDKPINNTDQIANLLLDVLKDGGETGSKDTKASGGDSQARPSKGEATEDPSI